jgi:antirestriction protein ArdC
MKNKNYEEVIEKITRNIEKGIMPWKMAWTTIGAPRNFITNKKYQGINCFILLDHNVSSNLWGTFKQVSDNGGKVVKGAVGYKIFFWKFLKESKLDSNSELIEETIPLLKCYTIFNLSQTTGLEEFFPKDIKPEISPDARAELIISQMPMSPEINFDSSRAYYSPSLDLVGVPRKESFISMPDYYSTLFHEIAHSTGHAKRLNRFEELKNEHAKGETYSREELIAEFTSSFLMAEAGIYNLDVEINSSNYIGGWLKFLKENPMALISCANKAQKAANYILNIDEQKEVE